MPNNKIVCNLYRSLLRITKKFDKNSAAKTLLYRKSTSSNAANATEHYYKSIVESILYKGKLFNPINGFVPLRDKVTEEFRKKHDVISSDRIDVGFALLRSFSSVWAKYIECDNHIKSSAVSTPPSDEKGMENMYDFPVRLTSEIQSGTVLLAHPLIQGHIHRAVVLILEYNKNGAYGLIINMHTDKTLATATRNVPAEILNTFGDNPVQFGGSTRRLQFLHPFSGIGGNLVSGSDPEVYAGGSVTKAIDIVRQDARAKDQFSFYAGCCFWSTKTLQSEIQHGYWIPVIAPTRNMFAISNQSREYLEEMREQALEDEDDEEEEEVVVSASEKLNIVANAPENTLAPPELWSVILQGLGSEYENIAQLPVWLDASKVDSMDWR